VIAAMSRRSNSDSCNSPASTSARMAGARSAVIQSTFELLGINPDRTQ